MNRQDKRLPPPPKKSLGQHFLKEKSIAARIVSLLQISSTDQILEIGPGPGALTTLIRQKTPARFRVIEKDTHWAAYHTAEGQDGPSKVEVLEDDALCFPWETLEGPWKVISNLPYNVGSPILWEMVSRAPELVRAVVMVQKEVAERLCAAPGTSAYGALSVWIQSFMRVSWGFVVGPGAFVPPPKVDSAVVVLTRRPKEEHPTDSAALAGVLHQCFQLRRKQLQAILKRKGVSEPTALLERLGIDPRDRPENLSPERFQQLAKAVYALSD